MHVVCGLSKGHLIAYLRLSGCVSPPVVYIKLLPYVGCLWCVTWGAGGVWVNCFEYDTRTLDSCRVCVCVCVAFIFIHLVFIFLCWRWRMLYRRSQDWPSFLPLDFIILLLL